jgi:Methylamine utilisation protein MauE
MGAWSGPFLVATLLLATAGLAKLVRPDDTVGALRAMGIRVPLVAFRAGGVLEAAVALGAALTGAPALAAVVAVSYLAFAGFVAVALARRLPIASCGCFGRIDTPPTVLHIVIDIGAAVCGIAVALRDGGGVVPVLRDQPLGGIPFLVVVAAGTYAAVTALTVLPKLTQLGWERS